MRKISTFLSSFLTVFLFFSYSYIALAQEGENEPPVGVDFAFEVNEHQHNDSVNIVFTVKYSEGIQVNPDFPIITRFYSSGAWTEYEVFDDAQISAEENVLTVTPARGFLSSGRYEFVVTFGAVTDLDGNRAVAFTRTF